MPQFVRSSKYGTNYAAPNKEYPHSRGLHRIGMDTSKHIFQLHGVNTAEEPVLRKKVWLMDRGVPTEEVLAEMRAADPPVHYLVGTPKGRLTRWKGI